MNGYLSQEEIVVPQLFQNLYPRDTGYFIATQMAAANYLYPSEPELPVLPDRTYVSNEELWADLIDRRTRANLTIKLSNFLLSEWFPYSPGLFHTWEARQSREHAMDFVVSTPRLDGLQGIDDAEPRGAYIDPDHLRHEQSNYMAIFGPYGKLSMLKGGIGSIRLRSKELPGGTAWFMSASSTPVAHEGVPIAVPDHYYQAYFDRIDTQGFLECTLVGKLKWIPNELSALYESYTGVQQLYLLVEEVYPGDRSRPQDLPFRVSVPVTFESRHEGRRAVYASYVTFYPGVRGSLEARTEWLENTYVKGMYQGRILTDFDEGMRQFEHARFSLSKVMGNMVSESAVRNYLWDPDEALNTLHQAHSRPAGMGIRHMKTQVREFEERYARLSRRIEALDTDIGRELDSEHKLVLTERREDLYEEREQLVARIAELEVQLAQAEGSQ